MDIHRVSVDTLPAAWPVVAPMLAPCVELLDGTYEMIDLYAHLLVGRWHLWVITEYPDKVMGAVVVELIDYPRKRVMRVNLLGGKDFAKWIDLFRFIEDWAVGQRCVGVEAWCRPGMSKHMRALDFIPQSTVYTKDLREPEDA